MLGRLLIITIIAIAGIIVNYLLHDRLGPFAPFSSWSSFLKLDSGAVPTQSPLAASVATSSTSAIVPSSTLAGAAVPAITSGSQTSLATSAPTPILTKYLTINGADMPGQDIAVDVGGSQATSQGTYGPSGCTAICSSNSGCKASVYNPTSKTCWIKSGLTPSSVQANGNLLLQVPDTSASGTEKNNYNYEGNDVMALKLPSSGDCSTLCRALPWGSCQGTTFEPDSNTCHIKAPAQNLKPTPNMISWAKRYVPPP